MENWKWEGWKVRKWGGDLFFSCFFFFFFFAFHFSKPVKFDLGLPKWEFSTGKKHFTPGKNQEKWLNPSEKNFLLCPCIKWLLFCWTLKQFMQQKVNEYQFQNSHVSIFGNLVQGAKIRWLTQLNLVVSSQKLGTEKVVNTRTTESVQCRCYKPNILPVFHKKKKIVD